MSSVNPYTELQLVSLLVSLWFSSSYLCNSFFDSRIRWAQALSVSPRSVYSGLLLQKGQLIRML
jgi:hypothetical protein